MHETSLQHGKWQFFYSTHLPNPREGTHVQRHPSHTFNPYLHSVHHCLCHQAKMLLPILLLNLVLCLTNADAGATTSSRVDLQGLENLVEKLVESRLSDMETRVQKKLELRWQNMEMKTKEEKEK